MWSRMHFLDKWTAGWLVFQIKYRARKLHKAIEVK